MSYNPAWLLFDLMPNWKLCISIFFLISVKKAADFLQPKAPLPTRRGAFS
jgi:hypothetical protein